MLFSKVHNFEENNKKFSRVAGPGSQGPPVAIFVHQKDSFLFFLVNGTTEHKELQQKSALEATERTFKISLNNTCVFCCLLLLDSSTILGKVLSLDNVCFLDISFFLPTHPCTKPWTDFCLWRKDLDRNDVTYLVWNCLNFSLCVPHHKMIIWKMETKKSLFSFCSLAERDIAFLLFFCCWQLLLISCSYLHDHWPRWLTSFFLKKPDKNREKKNLYSYMFWFKQKIQISCHSFLDVKKFLCQKVTHHPNLQTIERQPHFVVILLKNYLAFVVKFTYLLLCLLLCSWRSCEDKCVYIFVQFYCAENETSGLQTTQDLFSCRQQHARLLYQAFYDFSEIKIAWRHT